MVEAQRPSKPLGPAALAALIWKTGAAVGVTEARAVGEGGGAAEVAVGAAAVGVGDGKGPGVLVAVVLVTTPRKPTGWGA
jgi:hypothetical protein